MIKRTRLPWRGLLLIVLLACARSCAAIDDNHLPIDPALTQQHHPPTQSPTQPPTHTTSHNHEQTTSHSSTETSASTTDTDADTQALIQRLLISADSHRFGIPLVSSGGSNTKSATGGSMDDRVRPSVHSYPQHASLQHSIQSDKLMDIPTAIQLLEDAAALGSSQAFNDIGEMYLYGEGNLQPNYTLAARYFNRSSALGNPEAQHNLAIMSHLGLNSLGKPDESLAMVSDFFSAMGDNPLAKLSLGYRHLYGLNAPKSCDAAVAYYQQVSEAVVAQSLLSPINMVIEKARLSDDKSRSVPPEEDEDVIQYYQHSAENGDVGAQVALGHLHFYGARGFEQNPERAARYFKAAAAQGDTGAMSSLGQMHVQGLGVEQNNETAFAYLSEAAEKHNSAAQNGLGYLYLHGQGTQQDNKLALKWFKKSADQGNAEAQFNLGAMYFAGLGVDKKYQTALQYFTLAGHQGHTRALFNLGQMHINGLGTIKSCAIGVKLHKSVAERGNWATVCNEAHRNFLKGRYEHAWLQYARAAEEGYEVAQANSAYMLDMGLGFSAVEQMLAENAQTNSQSTSTNTGDATSSPSPSNLRYILAHRHWQMAAQQGHIDSLRMLGDYAFDGRVTGGIPDYPLAMKYYNQAAEHRNAQAIFNLGYMHEHGLGVSAPDFHLAKRFYDSCLESDPDALVPVKLALAKLYTKAYWKEWMGGEDTAGTGATGTSDTGKPSASSPSTPTGTLLPLPGPIVWFQDQLALSGVTAFIERLWRAESVMDQLLMIEDIILAILCASLAIIVYYRSQR